MIKAILQKKSLLLLLTLVFITSENQLSAQLSLRPSSAVKGETYALVIGIKEYQDEKIKDLRYADRDAQEFVAFLQSPNGGNVSEQNITLLTNEDATISNIYAAKRVLEEKVKKGDRLYFYFSGHGDVESSIYKLGFLIAYDTPFGNYLNNAVRIEDINIMANTLSVAKDVEVVLITDACHSGKLAGSDNRGKMLIGEQLAQVESKEIRIASCEASQLSQEDQAWGGGRGAFSFHLINGLNGAADEGRKNGIITLMELQNYLESIVYDDVLEIKEAEQIPVVEGKRTAKLAVIKQEIPATLTDTNNRSATEEDGSRAIRSTSESLLLSAFSAVTEVELSNIEILEQLTHVTDIQVLNWFKESFNIDDNFYRYDEQNEEILQQAKLGLATQLHNIVQQQINYYLAGDEKELKKRQFYNNLTEISYFKYFYMLDIASHLVDSNDQFYHMLQVKRHYFSGLIKRLMVLNSNNKDSMRQVAIQDQKMAYELEPNAPYVNNELGILIKFTDEEKAIKYFERAIELAPAWSFPYSNLANIYYKQNKHDKAEDLASKSLELNNEVYMAYFTLGKVYLSQKNLLLAEEYLVKAIELDRRYPINYLYLGHVMSELSNFEEAEANYILAEGNAMGFPLDVLEIDTDADGITNVFDRENNSAEFLTDLDSMNFLACFSRGTAYYNNNKFKKAKNAFYRCVVLEPNDPLAINYLARSHYYLTNYMEAEFFFEMANQKYQNDMHISEVLYLQYVTKYDTTGIYPEAYIETESNKEDIPYYLSEVYLALKQDVKYLNLCKEGVKNKDEYFYHALSSHYIKTGEYTLAIQLVDKFQWHSEKRKLLRKYEVLKDIAENSDDILDQYQTLNHMFNMVESDLFDNNDSDGEVEEIYFSQPITGKGYYYIIDIGNLTFFSILYFSEIENIDQADSMVQAKIYYLAGKLYDNQGNPDQAYSYFSLAKELGGHNNSFAAEFIQYGNKLHRYTDVFNEMMFLETNNLLNINQLPLYIDYSSRYGDYEKSTRLIEKFNRITLTKADTLQFNEFQNAYYTGDYELSGELIRHMVESKRMYQYEADYWKARIKMKQNNKESVYSYLDKAIQAGFSYPLVLKYDENFESISEDDKFQSLVNQLQSSIPLEN